MKNKKEEILDLSDKSKSVLSSTVKEKIITGEKYTKQIERIFEQHKHNDWDNEGAQGISQKQFEDAKNLFQKIFKNLDISKLSKVDIFSENEGMICFDWKNQDDKISISVSNDRIIFSQIINKIDEYGSKPNNEKSIKEIISSINLIYSK